MKSIIHENLPASLLGPKQGIVDQLDQAMLAAKAAENAKGRTMMPLRPSSSGYCTRELGYQLMEYRGKSPLVVDDTSAETLRIFSLGHSVEYHVLQHLAQVKSFQIKYKQQVLHFFTLPSGEHIEGSLDLTIFSADGRGIGDVKSKKDKFSSSHKTNWDETGEAYANMQSVKQVSDTFYWIDDLDAFLLELKDPWFAQNFWQLNLYANAEFIKQRGIDYAFILQYNKADSRMREFRFRPSSALFERTKLKFLSIAEAVDEHSDPDRLPRDAVVGSGKCAYCPYAAKCRPGIDTKEAFFETFPAKEWPVDCSRLPISARTEAEALYKQLRECDELDVVREQLEGSLCELLNNHKIQKVRFADGAIYEIKWLKSKRGNLALRRSKL